MRYLLLVTAFLLTCGSGCTQPAVVEPDPDKVKMDKIEPATIGDEGGGGGGAGQSMSQTFDG
jgi:hypothetical protein